MIGGCVVEGVHGREVHAWQGGMWGGSCVVEGYMHGKGGMHGNGGGAIVAGMCVWQVVVHAGEMATEAGSTHPTGIHSCCSCFL